MPRGSLGRRRGEARSELAKAIRQDGWRTGSTGAGGDGALKRNGTVGADRRRGLPGCGSRKSRSQVLGLAGTARRGRRWRKRQGARSGGLRPPGRPQERLDPLGVGLLGCRRPARRTIEKTRLGRPLVPRARLRRAWPPGARSRDEEGRRGDEEDDHQKSEPERRPAQTPGRRRGGSLQGNLGHGAHRPFRLRMSVRSAAPGPETRTSSRATRSTV